MIFLSTYASTTIFTASSSTPETWNHTDSRVGVVVPPTIRSCTNEVEHPGSIRALAIVLDPSDTVTFTVQVINRTCS